MQDLWEALCAWGVPGQAARARPARAWEGASVRALFAAAHASRFEGFDQTMRECLLAWLRGFRHHWPDRFEATLGSEGDAAIAALDDAAVDPGRYLKLRRIAIENLASIV